VPIEGFRWALKVECLPEALEATLWRATGTSRGAGGLRCECMMQALMAAIVLGLAGRVALGEATQAYPPCGAL
jgi:hypothetical protein